MPSRNSSSSQRTSYWKGGASWSSMMSGPKGAIRSRLPIALMPRGGQPETCVLHYKPATSLYPGYTPTYYAAVTDAYVIYPWELDRGTGSVGGLELRLLARRIPLLLRSFPSDMPM